MPQAPEPRPRVLLVDDEEPILFPMKAYFEAVGWRVACAREAAETEAILREGPFDVAVVDLQLTVQQEDEGLEVVDMIRARHPLTHVIVLTAHGTPEIESEVRRRGVDYLQKPTPLPVVARLMTSGLAERRAVR